jgi:acyl-CoA synthetase (AMP-forming)/AMP-acid ligase II
MQEAICETRDGGSAGREYVRRGIGSAERLVQWDGSCVYFKQDQSAYAFYGRGHLWIAGRVKDRFILSGCNCHPEKNEELLFERFEVGQAAAIGVPHEWLGAVGRVFFVPESGTDPTGESMIGWCRGNMLNDKVQKLVLRDRAVSSANL